MQSPHRAAQLRRSLMQRSTKSIIAFSVAAALGLLTWDVFHASLVCRIDPGSVQLAMMEYKILAYEQDTGALPKTLQGLLADDGASHWSGPYAKSAELAEFRGNTIHYELLDPANPSFRLFLTSSDGTIVRSRLGHNERSGHSELH
ncbi:hypothetical protein ELE36_18210 [Pseudolysobacter antarcticus]|uniref:Type II secretion system protein GspG C-terminal domain-containing protein n=1 Tax=Pseudolysobacter antarcticus TaxID=2511995 RepID=A0A411HNV4_9GAMM|nr:hypothetical protein [Pseudolysobacter antarcticus]QBB72142.1 hypothetical protein ELE36_18210 [Pseudolysobacter antarcticus]